MGNFSSVDREFHRRAQLIPRLGLGLSVDVYTPDIFELMTRFTGLDAQPGYLEIFRASLPALQAVRQRFPSMPFTYHGEGLWVTQPDFPTTPFVEDEIDEIVHHLDVLESPWLNHECATKQMAGYSFGTYLPPLYTELSARVAADNISLIQRKLDRTGRRRQQLGPLYLLELAPLTYFMVGTVSIPRFFRLVTELAPCGLVLDIGHLWTVYRYACARQELSLEQFVDRFLDEFPVERVIQIHIAGLGNHESSASCLTDAGPPWWVDSHPSPIQSVSFSMLEQVLAHPRLVNLRGVALEVDTKSIETIIEEFHEATVRYGPMIQRRMAEHQARTESPPHVVDRFIKSETVEEIDREYLQAGYARYARVITGQLPPAGPEWQAVEEDQGGLDRYVHEYLPHEILHWGGVISDMFPETFRGLSEAGIELESFVSWWFQTARPIDRPYDFFLLKIERLLAFVTEQAPGLLPTAVKEADSLRLAYAEANDAVHSAMEKT